MTKQTPPKLIKESFAFRLRAWFNNLHIQDPVERRMASLLQVILIGLIVLILFATTVLMAVPVLDTKEKLDALKGNFFGFLVVVLPLSLLRRGYFRSSALIIIMILFITPALAITVVFDLPSSGGILIQFTLAILLSGLLVSRRALVLVFGLSAALVAFSAFQGQSAEPRLARLSMETAINFILFNGLIALFLDRFGITLRTALTDALARETELQSEITERKRADEALKYSEERLNAIIEQSPLSIQVLSKDGTCLRVNPAWEQLWNLRSEQIIGYNLLTDHQVKEKGILPYLQKAFAGETVSIPPVFYDPAEIEKTSKARWTTAVIYPVKDGSGQVQEVVLTHQDITERKQAEDEIRKLNAELEQRVAERTAALSQANSLLQTLLNHMPDHIYFKDMKSRFIRNSRSQAMMLGVNDPAEVVGKTDFDFFPEPHARRSFGEEQNVIQSGQPIIDLEERVVWPDGRLTWVSTTKLPLRDAEGNITGTFGISRDITDRKQAEEELLTSNTQLDAANKELEAFSYSVSHDLRAPLRSIDGFSQAILEDYGEQLPEQGHQYLNRVRTAAQRMAELIDDMLNLSRVSRAPMKSETVDLSALAEKIVDDLQRAEPERQVTVSIAPGLETNGDSQLLQVVLMNLLSNAWKFTSKKEDARIEFDVEVDTDKKTFFVRDNGAGFDMTYAGKLFGAFQRLHSMEEFPGTGVGLATVKRIIARHGGTIRAEGTLDKGATFYFTLGQ